MPPLEHSIGHTPSIEPLNKRGDQSLGYEQKKALAQRLVAALEDLLPRGASLGSRAKRFTAYIDALPEGVLNREVRRSMVRWIADREKEGFKQASDETVVQYIEQLAAYERSRRSFEADQRRFVQDMAAYQGAREAYDRGVYAGGDWGHPTMRRPASPYRTTVRRLATAYTEAPEHRPQRIEASRQDVGLVDTRETEDDWKREYTKQIEALRASSEKIADPSRTEGLLLRLSKGPKALYAYLATITALLVAMPRGEQTFSAGVRRADEVSMAPARVSTAPRKEMLVDRYKQLSQASVERVGSHELHVRLGNGQGQEELFIVGSHRIQNRVQFEVGTGYRRVDLRDGQREVVEQQVRQIVRQALRPYQAQGINLEGINTVVDQIQVTLRGTASMEGRQAGNEALAARRVGVTRDLVDRAFAEEGIPLEMVSYQEEAAGVEGDMKQTVQELVDMGVRLRPGEEWVSFINRMASLERTEGVDGVRRLFALHGVSRLDEGTFNTFFERQFRSHRAVSVGVNVHHRRLVIHHPAPVERPMSPVLESGEKPATTTFYNDVDSPRYAVDDPPEQTNGQLERRRRRLHLWEIEADGSDSAELPPRRVKSPIPPVRPTPPKPPTLPRMTFDARSATAAPARPGPRTNQGPYKAAGNGGWTYTRNV